MAPSLRELIDFLLAEIALCGDQGASPSDILEFIETFYAKAAQDASNRGHNVDRRFQEKVWTWLTRNPEVSVGENRAGNNLSLSDVQSRASNSDDASQTPSHVFVSKERTWLAITGHEPDESKVLPTEFALLSIIASRKSSGISQTELVKLSGQDKRSVPKRTDTLQQKGYIEKRAVQIRSTRTSLCTLRRFLDADHPSTEAAGTPAVDADIMDYQEFSSKLFSILQRHQIISRVDLKKLLGFADKWRWRILSRALRKYERIGVLKRVKAMSQYMNSNKYFPCVKLIRVPTEKDQELFLEFSRGITANLEQDDNGELDEDVEPGDEAREPSLFKGGKALTVVKQEESAEEAGRILPVWTPDQTIHNLIFDAVERAGTEGIMNQEIIRVCFGGFYRRPLENTMSRLVECWQLSQPLHLRHLAIVRDTILNRTITQYNHYSANNFQKLVDAGESAWEAVEFTPKNPKVDKVSVPPVDARPELDKHGLPLAVPKKELFKNGDATLLECILAVNPLSYNTTSSDPSAMQSEDGTWSINYGHTKGSALFREEATGSPMVTPKRQKRDYPDVSDMEAGNALGTTMSATKRQKRPREESERFQGMTEKEKLEALGLDETWTEYNVLLIERPTPGVYTTPRGKRRPTGKRQGRPRISRIAVFKSSKLSSLPWFTEEAEATNDSQDAITGETPATTPAIARSATSPVAPNRPDGTPSRSGKRLPNYPTPQGFNPVNRTSIKEGQLPDRDLEPEDVTMVDAEDSQDHLAGRSTMREPKDDKHETPRRSLKRKRDKSPPPTPQEVAPEGSLAEDDHRPSRASRRKVSGTPSKNSRARTRNQRSEDSAVATGTKDLTSQTTHEETETGTASLTSADTRSITQIEEAAQEKSKTVDPTPVVQESSRETPLRDAERPESITDSNKETDSTQKPVPKSQDRENVREKKGSVGFIRRKIVMDIVEMAGGAFPMGTEIWYPFATAWKKSKYKETPDSRTVKATIKHLIESGKLRQLTFSGRDSKGVMVTKSIISKPSVHAEDPLILDMQKKMLAVSPRHYIPTNVEYDANMTKSGSRRVTFGKDGRDPNTVSKIPLEPEITVQLQHKPAFVASQEKRKGLSIQKKLLQRIGPGKENQRKVVRLMSLQKPSAQDSVTGMTSISRPDQIDDLVRRGALQQQRPWRPLHEGLALDRAHRMKRLRKSISSMAPYAMLMNPRQTFQTSTGTFATDGGLAALQVARRTQKKDNMPHSPELYTEYPEGGLPHSLDDLFSKTRRRTLDYSESIDPRSNRFFHDNDVIMRWELRNQELLGQRSADTFYINQTVRDSFNSAPIEGSIRFDVDEPARPFRPAPTPKITRQKARRSLLSDQRGTPSGFAEDSRRQETPRNRRLEKLDASMAADEADGEIQTPGVRPSVRRNRAISQLPDLLVQRIMTAIAVVRALAGGAEGKIVDWTLVLNSFPGHDPQLIQAKGKSILNKSRLQLAKLQNDFQDRFLEAYACGQIPPINYDDLESYDWEGVVDWANTQLDAPRSERLPDLPATKEQFDAVFELREEPSTTLDELYQATQTVTMNRKRALYAGTPFAVPLPEKRKQTARKEELSRLEVAKTWIRANVVTPEDAYRPAEARQDLSRLGNHIDRAIDSLTTERVISMGKRGRVAPGRNFDITDHFLFTLGRKRVIESTQLRRAAKFKTQILDPSLRSAGKFDVNYNAEDGDMMAMINLAAEGRLLLKFRDPPRNKYGLVEGGYITRDIDKHKLRFAVEAHPVKGKYVYGNPLEKQLSAVPAPLPPKATSDGSSWVPEKIPLWCDIHGGFIKLLWELAAAAVAGCVAGRPGISASGISSMVKPTMGAWEVELLLKWMAEVGVMQQAGHDFRGEMTWRTQEWWWMITS
ncbi:hypothetical protein BDV25DRAFT_93729 [Aspergillus avenaceus]|uniref:Uncharacterized protein n=1 Tax=Aspergillus avenaceus TaxID=36643 RepID=A0A5N6U7U0_ASPAV|nr:hypothetical protein BDV25DRAFT_93729 [Aspergillus avenaceus]